MPLFADIAAMLERFQERDLIQLSNPSGTTLDEARIEEKLLEADSVITGYVAARHKDVPALAGNAILRNIACDLAFAELYRSDPPKFVTERQTRAISRLREIQAGTFKLDQGEETIAPRPGQILTSGDERKFSRGSLSGY